MVCGIDEAGRGALAGPLVAAGVILKPKTNLNAKDSKLLGRLQREKLFEIIKVESIDWAYSVAGVEEINRVGIQAATYVAFHRVISELKREPDFLLIDHYRLPATIIPQLNLTFGDRLTKAIGAASIVAKVIRDKIMRDLSGNKKLKYYDFANNFGYGTKKHLEAINRFGISCHHRLKYKRVSNPGRKLWG